MSIFLASIVMVLGSSSSVDLSGNRLYAYLSEASRVETNDYIKCLNGFSAPTTENQGATTKKILDATRRACAMEEQKIRQTLIGEKLKHNKNIYSEVDWYIEKIFNEQVVGATEIGAPTILPQFKF